MKILNAVFLLFLCNIFFSACNKESAVVLPGEKDTNDSTVVTEPPAVKDSVWDFNSRGIPRFVNTLYADLDSVYKISRFRSGIGHSYTDNFETCRSMKHYFFPRQDIDWSRLYLRSPVKGTIVKAEKEQSFGTQLWIRYDSIPAFNFIIFHVVTDLKPGDKTEAGMVIGHHVGTQTTSDIAVGVNTPGGYKLVSFFEICTAELMNKVSEYGIHSPADLIITREERDKSPLSCSGEAFSDEGSLPNWVILEKN